MQTHVVNGPLSQHNWISRVTTTLRQPCRIKPNKDGQHLLPYVDYVERPVAVIL